MMRVSCCFLRVFSARMEDIRHLRSSRACRASGLSSLLTEFMQMAARAGRGVKRWGSESVARRVNPHSIRSLLGGETTMGKSCRTAEVCLAQSEQSEGGRREGYCVEPEDESGEESERMLDLFSLSPPPLTLTSGACPPLRSPRRSQAAPEGREKSCRAGGARVAAGERGEVTGEQVVFETFDVKKSRSTFWYDTIDRTCDEDVGGDDDDDDNDDDNDDDDDSDFADLEQHHGGE
eukprot:267-Hanusia_phi.AAC.3